MFFKDYLRTICMIDIAWRRVREIEHDVNDLQSAASPLCQHAIIGTINTI